MSHDQILTRDAILDAAEQVLRRYGPEKTSVVDIAKALNVSHGTLYRHFASKAALREAVTERWLDASISAPLEAIVHRTDGSAADRLRSWMEALIQAKRTYLAQDAEMFAMYTAVTVESVAVIHAHVDHLVRQMAQIVEGGMRSGEFKAGRPEDVARALFSATARFHHPAHAQEWLSGTMDADFEAVWRLLLSGLAA
ncbi:TetR family transcriptional regulator [Cohnella nanjingensis]|uniref:TetR family transcriptional regulator n=1 Tax=Cohnella nanjingensis TaxID=1387779 RepID=A0A7X0RTS6_9BACL|nr:TetR family transcriptional regulator [Cohnella nanjingensis]MBB6672034.1 TetR family transcriptional regulator [Cohnella nanjingensis]